MIDPDAEETEPAQAGSPTPRSVEKPAGTGAAPKSGTLFRHRFGIAPAHLDRAVKAGDGQKDREASAPVQKGKSDNARSGEETG